ncbi:MAG: EAL domain-containing protein [Paraglaciecola sp.]|nr:EAL domain-containing protein [Paraglaciecola sp.]
MAESSDRFEFNEENNQDIELSTGFKQWKILSVEDNQNYQAALTSSLASIELPDGVELTVLKAASVYEASSILNAHKDIALILLDVVMEEDDSGLKLVKIIRDELANGLVRIVLLTGQPGFAPEKEVMKALDIDEYWNKADLTLDKLHSIVKSNLRTWNVSSQLAEAKQGLQLVLDAARSINSRYDLPSFTRAVLTEIGNIMGVKKGGLLCIGNNENPYKDTHVLTASGCYTAFEGVAITDSQLVDIRDDINQAFEQKQHKIGATRSVFYFETSHINEKVYVIVVTSDAPITEAHINLLRVFSENISSGFTNIALLNRVTELAYTHLDLNIPNLNWLKKEIQNMSITERQETRLLMIEVKYFDEMKFTFGYEFILNLLKAVYLGLCATFPPPARISLSGHKHFSILIATDIPITQALIHALTFGEFKKDEVVHSTSFTLLDMRLDAVQYTTPAKLISTAESVLKEAVVNNLSYIQNTQRQIDEMSRRYHLMGELRKAIRERKLTVMLQPKLALSSNKVVGFEALARWQRDDGSFVRPDEFIAIAETSGLITMLDNLIVEKTIAALQQLCALGYQIPIAFNASSFDLLHTDYFSKVFNCLSQAGVSPHLLELEVTETQTITDYEKIKATLQKFVDSGIKISIDDFGTGYSSLSRISNITAHCIKIDRSFINQLEQDDVSQHVVNMILTLGKKCDFTIVAEGIETEFQKNWLRSMGCDIGQGYLFAKPMCLEHIVNWLPLQDNA